MNERQLLAALRRAQAERRAVALVTATSGDGAYAQQIGRHLLVWSEAEQGVIGDLALGELADEVLEDCL